MKNEVCLKVCLYLKTVLLTSIKAKRIDKDEEEVLAHCEKRSKDLGGLAGLCKLLFSPAR